MGCHERSAPQHAVVDGLLARGRVDCLHARADVLVAITAPRPRIANHIVQAEIIPWETAHVARCGLPAKTGETLIQAIAPRKKRSLASGPRRIFPLGITRQPIRLAGRGGVPRSEEHTS